MSHSPWVEKVCGELEERELLVLVGPTASGKTALALELAEAIQGVIIGADSVQIYQHFNIGSGKPTAEERARAPHDLVDILDPLAAYDAAQYVRDADDAIGRAIAAGRRPIVCGGTFLWIKALIHGLAPMPPGDPAIRLRHDQIVGTKGRAELHAQLIGIDPAASRRINPNDFVRVSRALEVFELTGKTQSAWHAEHAFGESRHEARFVGIDRPRPELDARIERRTAHWLAHGWIEEVEGLLASGYRDARAMDAVGYRQVRDHLDGVLPHSDLKDAIVRATRTFVRRQRTWLRDQDVHWLRHEATNDGAAPS